MGLPLRHLPEVYRCVLQIHLGLSGTNSYWVMWATGQGKVYSTSLTGCTPILCLGHNLWLAVASLESRITHVTDAEHQLRL